MRDSDGQVIYNGEAIEVDPEFIRSCQRMVALFDKTEVVGKVLEAKRKALYTRIKNQEQNRIKAERAKLRGERKAKLYVALVVMTFPAAVVAAMVLKAQGERNPIAYFRRVIGDIKGGRGGVKAEVKKLGAKIVGIFRRAEAQQERDLEAAQQVERPQGEENV